MKCKRLHLAGGVAAAALLAVTSAALADDDHSLHSLDSSSGNRAYGLEKEVIIGTRPYRDVAMAEAAGWVNTQNCVSGPDVGAMGVHFVNFGLVPDDQIDPQQPEVLIYEMRDGRFRLVGAEFFMLADIWHAGGRTDTPILMGQLFHYNGAPNRYGLPPFYALHVWAWRDNPHGTYSNWNPNVSCDQFVGP
jgi:hypothetical protein